MPSGFPSFVVDGKYCMYDILFFGVATGVNWYDIPSFSANLLINPKYESSDFEVVCKGLRYKIVFFSLSISNILPEAGIGEYAFTGPSENVLNVHKNAKCSMLDWFKSFFSVLIDPKVFDSKSP